MANRLAGEKSPYLLQHANNPVDWYPWGEEAFRAAREQDKPIFLSIGYSTCHWCHVMERESFEDDVVARALNANFVPIKVDREERPDVDRIYMTFVQATTGSGGWPMSVFLTPDLKPFFGGTYFPPENRYGQPGFIQVLQQVAEAWKADHDRVLESGADVVEQLSKHLEIAPGSSAGLDEPVLERAFYAFRRIYDPKWGGFGGAPKFPRLSTHNFLLRYWHRTGHREAFDMVDATLKAMARGGINDHLGGGFHRYSVDERWFLPHFEKMLYDQAQLAASYVEAYQISGEQYHAGIARATLDYVLRDMTHPGGGFYSAEDADSPDPERPGVKGEGAFYVWTRAEIEQALGQPAADLFSFRHGVSEEGNVREDPHHEFAGRNVLYEAHSIEETATHFRSTPEEVRRSLTAARAKLLERRSRRPRPHLDDKVLTAWNGLMISAFARAGQVLEEERYLNAARRAADFILHHCWRETEGHLLRRFRNGEAGIDGFLDDYAFFAQALLDLYETGFETRHLDAARLLTERMVERFEDAGAGGFYSTAAGSSDLVLRMKDDYDGAEPSGNSIAVFNLLRLSQYFDRGDFREAAERALAAFSTRLTGTPAGVPQMLAALAYALGRKTQVILVGEREAADTRALLRAMNGMFVPNKVVMLVDSDRTRDAMAEHLPAVAMMRRIGAAATAYVCEDYACRLPTADVEQFKVLLRQRGPAGAAGG